MIIPTRSRQSHFKQFCLWDLARILYIVSIIQMVLAIRFFVAIVLPRGLGVLPSWWATIFPLAYLYYTQRRSSFQLFFRSCLHATDPVSSSSTGLTVSSPIQCVKLMIPEQNTSLCFSLVCLIKRVFPLIASVGGTNNVTAHICGFHDIRSNGSGIKAPREPRRRKERRWRGRESGYWAESSGAKCISMEPK